MLPPQLQNYTKQILNLIMSTVDVFCIIAVGGHSQPGKFLLKLLDFRWAFRNDRARYKLPDQ